ncbi:hypothetical protein [Flavobacterium psychrophilum]|uniref:hypothetical protein n=1 Tax=Flavobacterium psychrophilum TaxID=96345 RepID=UPI001069971E|nr:hypothetical protein [Flavobacterium psychrophilum]
MKKQTVKMERKLVFQLSDVKKELDRSYLIEDNGVNLFFQKAKCIVTSETIEVTNEMYQNSYDYAMKKLKEKEEQDKNPVMIKLFGSNAQHSEKSQSIDIVLLCNGNDLKHKFFIAKSQIKEITDDYIVFPKWLYDSELIGAKQNKLNWAKDNGGAELTEDDYEMKNTFEEVN